jgi:hypothetical protein
MSVSGPAIEASAQVRQVVNAEENEFLAIAERSCVVGYEQCLGAVSIEAGS